MVEVFNYVADWSKLQEQFAAEGDEIERQDFWECDDTVDESGSISMAVGEIYPLLHESLPLEMRSKFEKFLAAFVMLDMRTEFQPRVDLWSDNAIHSTLSPTSIHEFRQLYESLPFDEFRTYYDSFGDNTSGGEIMPFSEFHGYLDQWGNLLRNIDTGTLGLICGCG